MEQKGIMKRAVESEEGCEESKGYSEQSKRRREGFNKRKASPLYYHTYLGLDKLLTSQRLMSAEHTQTNGVSTTPQSGCPMDKANKDASTAVADSESCPFTTATQLEASNRAGAHDEHLFIVIHQAFELWFKQILWELGDAQKLMNNEFVPERNVSTVINRLTRVVEILRLLVDQFTILETMSPLGFLEFRDYLFPASGFQSVQWRKLECAMGLSVDARASYGPHGQASYCAYLTEEHKAELKLTSAAIPSLHELITRWLERTPFCSTAPGKDGTSGDALLSSLWDHYKVGVNKMLSDDRKFVVDNYFGSLDGTSNHGTKTLDENMKAIESSASSGDEAAQRALKQLGEVTAREASLATILDANLFEEARQRGEVQFTHKAMTAALIITLYQEEPVLQQAYRLLKAVIDIDELMTVWRQRHALMVHRMIGVKMGTGGSSGYHYLQEASLKHRVFKDLFNLSTFLVPRCELPPLPPALRNKLNFAIESTI